MKKTTTCVPLFLLALCSLANARGVSPYLPLYLEPEIERQIERALILADKPILKRPIAAATVLDALPKACDADPALCAQVRRYLGRYMHNGGVSHTSVEVAASTGASRTIPNRRGLTTDASWATSGLAYLQPSDYVLLSLGGIAYDGESVPAGSVLSVGTSRAQLDIGYREHWLSPMTDSSMLLSTESLTMPSVTLSNYAPLTRLGLYYEAFLARMDRSDRIVFVDPQDENDDGFTSGYPRLAGLHFSIEPASGWSLGISRILQYGGGERSASFRDLLDALFMPSDFDNAEVGGDVQEQVGNQAAAITSRFVYPGPVPFAVYFEYAGEDTSHGKDYLLGNSALSAGIHFPRLGRRFDLTYEVSEWQNAWYVHELYLDGLTNDGRVIGHWGADQRVFEDAVGAQSHMLRLGWEPAFGGVAELRLRTLENESYGRFDYERAYDVTLRYARQWHQFYVGGEIFAGRDVFGEDFSRVGLFLRYADGPRRSVTSLYEPSASEAPQGAELFVVAGVNVHEVRIDLQKDIPRTFTDPRVAPHFAVGVRRAASPRNDIGMRLEFDEIDGHLMIGARAVDYRFRFNGPLAVGAFLGAARYDLATPAYGIYGGVGAEWRDVVRGWDLGLDVRYITKVARDHLLPEDPPGEQPDSFYDITSVSLYVTRRF